jgi:hypothetical protein
MTRGNREEDIVVDRSDRVAIVARALISSTLSRNRVHQFGAGATCERTTHERRCTALVRAVAALSDSIPKLNCSGSLRRSGECVLQFGWTVPTGSARQ